MSPTAERLMDLAEAHIRDRGYGGFSFRDLAAEAGIKSASVHHHFPTKAKMAAAVANRYAKRFLKAVEAKPGERPEDAIGTYRTAVRMTIERDGRMCLCGILGAEAGALAPEVTSEVQSFFRRCIEDLARRVSGPDATAQAHHIIATLEGAMILARAYGDIGAFDQATSALISSATKQTS
ncbi:TetR/AcrR family transcriptional regulator [Rhizobium multihospitium]|uniref:Transcriptional regulator, TetR family n=1 Tax=Rhizobium multihospitium TaxID=410764 RepID=A0A1C3XE47_9HYPH|nr:TetR/AcrR family transcriptional regulator [Rhizobium multihospitium]SCB50254.1 transcriptional regulator, TetR family [Rhizobium multihospitium]